MFLDGGNSNFTKVLIDGAPANQPGGDIDLEGFDLGNLDKIEIVHGASSALYGSDAMTGTVELFTHRGTTTIPIVSVFADGGTFGTGHGGGNLSGVLGKFDYSASASYFSTAGQGAKRLFSQHRAFGSFWIQIQREQSDSRYHCEMIRTMEDRRGKHLRRRRPTISISTISLRASFGNSRTGRTGNIA